jgi:hypothetical protein
VDDARGCVVALLAAEPALAVRDHEGRSLYT